MNKAKKLVFASLVCLTAIFGALGFASCDMISPILSSSGENPIRNGSSKPATDTTNSSTPTNTSNTPKGESIGLEYTLNEDETAYSVTGIGACTDTDIVFPSTYQGLPVTSIGNDAFCNCIGLTSVVIPESVTSIGDFAFDCCYKLVEVYNKSPLSITAGSEENGHVGYYAKAIYTEPYTSKLSTDKNGYILYTDDEDKILIGYTGTKAKLDLPSDITEIYGYAFYDRADLTSVAIPDGVTSIGDWAFYACSGLTSVAIPESVTSIGDYAFDWCYKLVEVYNTSSLPITAGSEENGYVGYYAKMIYTEPYTGKLSTDENGYTLYTDGEDKILIGYTGKKTELILPNGITEINRYAFYKYTGLKSVKIPDSVTEIGDYAFEYCTDLTSVTIGNGVTEIGNYAFEYCSGLTSVAIPDNVISIGEGAFEACDGLKSVTIGNGVTEIGYAAFAACTGLKSVTIGDRVTSIGNYAFYNCIGLTSLAIPDRVTSIGWSAFEACIGLTSVTIGSGVTQIGSDAFYYCADLASITVSTDNANYKSIDGNLYTKDEKTLIQYAIGKTDTSFTVPDSVTSIVSSAFSSCENLTSVKIGKGVTSIGDWAFFGCSNLTSITFSDTSTWYRTASSTDWGNKTGGTRTNVMNASNNVTYFTSMYDYCYWYKR